MKRPDHDRLLSSPSVPSSRINQVNTLPFNSAGNYILYWMIGARRLRWNFALQHAVNLAIDMGRPLIVLEVLRCDYPWASNRLHRFVLDGMVSNAREAAASRALYYPYVEPAHGAGRGLLASLGRNASGIVTDWCPTFLAACDRFATGSTFHAGATADRPRRPWRSDARRERRRGARAAKIHRLTLDERAIRAGRGEALAVIGQRKPGEARRWRARRMVGSECLNPKYS